MNNRTKSEAGILKRRIGENIRRIRLSNNIEVKKLCSDLNLSAAAYSNIERGITDINISRIMQLAGYFGVHYGCILSTDGNNNFTQNMPQETNANSFAIVVQHLREENHYLKEQNNMLINMLTK